MGKTFTYDVWTSGMKEYRIEFEDVEDAERACEIAEIWNDDYRGVYEPWLGDTELYIVCRNDTLHRFLDVIKNGLGLVEGEVE